MQIGSLSWSVLPGKIMFRNVAYMTNDYTVRVQDGYLIFRWWRKYVLKDGTAAGEDLSHSDTRMSVQLNGFEFHVYNRTKADHRAFELGGPFSYCFSLENLGP